MKSIKKTLSVVLAAVMLFTVCAMSVSAAVPDGNVIALGIKVKDGQVIEKGKPVTFVVTLEETADFYSNYGGLNVGEFEIAYNSAIFEPVPTTGYGDSSLAGHGVSVKKSETESYAVAGGVDTVNSSVKAAEYGVDAVNNWDSAMHITLIENGAADLAARYVDCSKGAVDTFEFQLKVKADAADGTYKIGHNKTGYDNYATYVISGKDGDASHGWFVFEEATVNCTPIYDFGTCDVTVGAGGSGDSSDETTAAVEHDTTDTLKNTKVRWATTEEDSRNNVLYVGFEGKLTGVSADKVSTIKEIGFRFSTSDATLKEATNVKTFVIYDFTSDGTGYKFRSIVRRPLAKADIDGTVTHNIYAQAYVIVDGTTTPITASDIISTTLKAEYAQGVAQGMEDRFAQ